MEHVLEVAPSVDVVCVVDRFHICYATKRWEEDNLTQLTTLAFRDRDADHLLLSEKSGGLGGGALLGVLLADLLTHLESHSSTATVSPVTYLRAVQWKDDLNVVYRPLEASEQSSVQEGAEE